MNVLSISYRKWLTNMELGKENSAWRYTASFLGFINRLFCINRGDTYNRVNGVRRRRNETPYEHVKRAYFNYREYEIWDKVCELSIYYPKKRKQIIKNRIIRNVVFKISMWFSYTFVKQKHHCVGHYSKEGNKEISKED